MGLPSVTSSERIVRTVGAATDRDAALLIRAPMTSSPGVQSPIPLTLAHDHGAPCPSSSKRMPPVVHRCPTCGAPVEALPSRCVYCGAMVVDSTPAAVPTRTRTETWGVVVIGPVGFSNRARVAETLRRYGVSIEDASRFVEAARTEIVMGTQIEQAKEFVVALREAGASAVVEEREIQIPLEPDRAVVLDAVGASAARVAVALRAHVDLDMGTGRQLVGTAPCTLTGPLPAPRAHALLDALVAAGAQAHLVYQPRPPGTWRSEP